MKWPFLTSFCVGIRYKYTHLGLSQTVKCHPKFNTVEGGFVAGGVLSYTHRNRSGSIRGQSTLFRHVLVLALVHRINHGISRLDHKVGILVHRVGRDGRRERVGRHRLAGIPLQQVTTVAVVNHLLYVTKRHLTKQPADRGNTVIFSKNITTLFICSLPKFAKGPK